MLFGNVQTQGDRELCDFTEKVSREGGWCLASYVSDSLEAESSCEEMARTVGALTPSLARGWAALCSLFISAAPGAVKEGVKDAAKC